MTAHEDPGRLGSSSESSVWHEYVILFPYHSTAPQSVLRQNLKRVLDFNPDVPVIPLIHDGEPLFPGTVDVRNYECPWATTDKWRSCDTIAYRWFLRRAVSARRYIILEWDMYSTTSVREFYSAVWNAEIAAADTFTLDERPHWFWFNEVGRLGALKPYAAALGPLAGVLASHEALEAICRGPILHDVFCELRLGTLANHAGCKLTSMDVAQEFITWHPDHLRLGEKPGIYHPVKHLIGPQGDEP